MELMGATVLVSHCLALVFEAASSHFRGMLTYLPYSLQAEIPTGSSLPPSTLMALVPLRGRLSCQF